MLRSNLLSRAIEIARDESFGEFLHSVKRFLFYREVFLQPIGRFRAHVRNWKYQIQYGNAAPESYKLWMVEVDDIELWTDHKLRSEIGFSRFGTQILAGDWDQEYLEEQPTQIRYRKMERSLEAHFERGIPWEQTEIYDYVLNNQDVFRYPPEYLDTRLKNLERVFESMKNEGYKTQRELQRESGTPIPSDSKHPEIPTWAPPEIHEISIAITRNGTMAWFFAGHHRLMLARLAGVDKIPVRVVLRHKDSVPHKASSASCFCGLSSVSKRLY
jgi:hypothetical protein